MTLVPVSLHQTPPLTDIVPVLTSTSYTNQLNVSNAQGVVTWQAETTSPELTVYPSGAIVSGGAMPIGTYLLSGVMFDNSGNSGTWSFTLTVTAGPSSPETVVTPIQAAMPTGVEIAVPFRIDSISGGVAYLGDYKRIVAQHIETICLTLIGERVMMPNYGTRLEAALFSPMIPADNALLAQDILNAVQRTEPRVRVDGVIVGSPDPSTGILGVTITYEILPFGDLNRMRVTTGGTIIQVIGR
jgi:phage baseplate assembly protein W